MPIVIVLVIVCLHFLMREAFFERASVRKRKVSFPPPYGLRAVFFLGIPLELFGAYQVCLQAHWILGAFVFLLAPLQFLFYPGTITLNDKEIVLRRYFGLKITRIDWDEVESVVSSKAFRTISVFAKDGRSIVHTQFHVDPLRFQVELKRHRNFPLIER
jgi:hypothetical protein